MTVRRPGLGPSVTLAHGGGGKAMHDLIAEVFVRRFGSAGGREDQARLPLSDLQSLGDRLAFTTDSYVVDPLFFPGGDIGTLAVNGTINDLAMGGAIPVALSCAIIAEEGLPIEVLERVAESMHLAAAAAGAAIVTGDTKVVNRGAADKLFINTSGIGVIASSTDFRAERACVGDAVLVNGFLGDHGATILNARGGLGLDAAIKSDTQPLHGVVQAMIGACVQIHCMRDATRGGLATVLNEFARAAQVCIELQEDRLPIREEVRGVCAILGLDPLYFANEGKLVALVPRECADAALMAMQAHPMGTDSAIVGEVRPAPQGVVTLRTRFGGERIVDMLMGEQLPRIC